MLPVQTHNVYIDNTYFNLTNCVTFKCFYVCQTDSALPGGKQG